jgi:hypothetical protein
MNKAYVMLFVCAFTFLAKAQNPSVSLPVEQAKNIILQEAPWLLQSQNNFELNAMRSSKVGHHLLFTQTHQGLPVYGATCKVNIGLNQNLLSIFNGFEPIYTTLNLPASAQSNPAMKWCWFKQNNEWQLAQRKLIQNAFNEVEEFILSAKDGSTLQQKVLDLNVRRDTLVRTKVFNPDPLTSAQKEYGENGLYRNNNGANTAELAAELKDKFVTLTWQNDTFYPWSPYVTIRDLESPVQAVFNSTAANFDFNRSNSQFREMNCLYHIETFRKYLAQIGLPFTDMAPIDLDPTAYSGQDQSRFSYSVSEPALYFGTGGVPDAEDADVIIHEYTHYLNFYLAPNTVNGNERLAVEEANCDFMACMHSKAVSNFNWRRIFNWDGFNEYWAGRDGNSNATYPKDLSTDFYRSSLIWSSMLNDLSEDIGREVLTKLLLQSVYSYANNINMQTALNLLVQADSLLYNYANLEAMRASMEKRGFLVTGLSTSLNSQLNLQILNSANFASGKGLLSVEANTSEKLQYRLITMDGIICEENAIPDNQFKLSSQNLKPGVYLLQVSNEKGQVHVSRLVVFGL